MSNEDRVVKRVYLEAKITHKDGTVEDLGIIYDTKNNIFFYLQFIYRLIMHRIKKIRR